MWSLAWVTLCLLLSATVSVASAVVSTEGQRDASDTYLILAPDLNADDEAFFERLDVWEIGPERAHLARMVTADPHAHAVLVESGYWVIPASVIAQICGISRS